MLAKIVLLLIVLAIVNIDAFTFHASRALMQKSSSVASLRMATESNAGGDASKVRPINLAKSETFKIRSAEWAKVRGMEPGFGGYWPGDPNAKKWKVTLRDRKTGKEYTEMIPEDRYIFFYFEELGIELPIINKQRMCRQGCCTQCTIKVVSGEVELDSPLGLLKEFRKDNYALSCSAFPRSDIVAEFQDEDEMYDKQWGSSFAKGKVEQGGVLPEDH
eukprot:gene3887-4247_t